MNVCFATIVSANYLAYAGVLARSLARHAPATSVHVLVVDRATAAVRQAVERSGLQVTFAEDLGIPDFERVAYKFDLVELNTALKPTFLLSLFDAGFDGVVYVDPDIQFHAAPTPVFEAMQKASITLTPHALAPVMDGLRPSDVDFLRNGTFNLGFVALHRSDEAMRMLKWWEDRCLGLGFNDPAFGVFVDQKWMDLVPAYFDSFQVLRHPGCNVAYWNLHEREVTMRDGQYHVNDHPLVFFHFSGVRAQQPSELSRHQTRHQLIPGSPLATLVGAYCAELLAGGHAQTAQLPYTYGTLDDGTPITPTMRRAAVCAPASTDPFRSGGSLQVELRSCGMGRVRRPTHAISSSTLDFDPADWRVRIVNLVVRLASRLIGVERFRLLLRYAAVLTRESHYAAVLMRRPLDFTHRARR